MKPHTTDPTTNGTAARPEGPAAASLEPLLVGPDQKWLTTQQFMDKLAQNLDRAFAA